MHLRKIICIYVYIHFHFTYITHEEIRDFEMYLSVISNDMILMLLFPYTFEWFFIYTQ